MDTILFVFIHYKYLTFLIVYFVILEKRKELASVASGTEIEETFECELPSVYQFHLQASSLVKLKEIRKRELKKKDDVKLKRMGLLPDPPVISSALKTKRKVIPLKDATNHTQDLAENNSSKAKVDIEYLNILLPYLKHYNAACALCICTRYFGRNTLHPTSLLLKCILKCSGSNCHFKCNVHIFNDGRCFVTGLNRKVFHTINERISRPIRGSRREKIKEKFRAGGSVYRVHAQYNQQRTVNERRGFNYDVTGKSKRIFKKIKAEVVSESLLSSDFQIGTYECLLRIFL